MDKKRFFTALIMAVVLSVGTYFALMHFLPYKPEELKLAENPSVDEVFGGTLDPADPGAAAPAESAPASDASAAPAADDTMTADPMAADAAGTAPVESAAMDLSSLASEAPAADPAPAAAEPAAAEPEAAVVATAEPAPVEEAAPAPAVEEVAAPAPKPKRAVKQYTGSREAAAPETAAKAWWGEPSADGLSLNYAGAASFKKAIALLFSGPFENADSLNQNVVVTTAKGKAVAGTWQVSAGNKRMATLDVEGPGTYIVTVKAGVTDQGGKATASDVSGPVNVY